LHLALLALCRSVRTNFDPQENRVTLISPAPSAALTQPAAAEPRRIAYSPALDGLRGLAVLAVLLYHGGVTWAAGGHLGVDAFFVLSGYLITSLLLNEWREEQTIALLAFWSRRARRLLPALFVMLVGMALFCLFVAKPDNLDQLRADGIATLFYSMNWRLIWSGQDYFNLFTSSPFEHMWSLAIEEQYYLIWPIFTLAVMRLRKSPRFMFGLCLSLAIVSALWMFKLYDPEQNPSRLYYGTDTRAQSLLIGSALAALLASGVTITATARRVLLAAAGLALVILGFSWMRTPYTEPVLYHGGFFVSACLVGVIITACTHLGANPVRSVLSFEPLRRIGIISYGVYLCHWPIYAWLNDERTGLARTSLRLLALRLAVTFAVATASFFLLEKPIRQGALQQLNLSPRMRNLLVPVAAALVLVLLLTSTAGAQRTTPVFADYDPANRLPPIVEVSPSGAADSTKALLVGDSVGYTLGVGFEGEVSEANHLAVWNQAVLFCELVRGAHRENGVVLPPSDKCVNWESDWRHDVELFNPEVTVLQLGAWEIFDREIDGEWIAFGTPEYDAILEPILQRGVDALSSGGAPVIVLTTPRFTRTDGTQEWLINDVSRTDHFNALLKRLAEHNQDRVVLVDLGNYLCPANDCHKEINGVKMRPDGVHFKEPDARVVAAWLAPTMRKLGLETAAARAGNATPGSTPPGTATAGTAPAPATTSSTAPPEPTTTSTSAPEPEPTATP
jgi:peptidoglycan/LPS O-acetylase OafA/YrhL